MKLYRQEDCSEWEFGTPPVPGVWQQSNSTGRAIFRYWDGSTWYYRADTPDEAVANYNMRIKSVWAGASITYRGLKNDPNAPKADYMVAA